MFSAAVQYKSHPIYVLEYIIVTAVRPPQHHIEAPPIFGGPCDVLRALFWLRNPLSPSIEGLLPSHTLMPAPLSLQPANTSGD